MARPFALSVCAGLSAHTHALQVSSDCKDLVRPRVAIESFEDFVQKYGREYSAEEYGKRKELFDSRVAHIAGHNCADERPWKAEVNHMADWTESELKSIRGYRRAATQRQAAPPLLSTVQMGGLESLPETLSYSHLESIRKSRNQGKCGSCWAYAAATVLDAHAEINNRSHSFSVAQILACTPNPQMCGGSGGCRGATAELAFEYVLQAGVVEESEFPELPGGAQAQCPDDKKPLRDFAMTGKARLAVELPDGTQKHYLDQRRSRGLRIGMLGFSKFPQNTQAQLLQGLVKFGPAAVAVAVADPWHWYKKGIMTPQDCDRNNVVNHLVVLYGYGKATTVRMGVVDRTKYWLIKNSWGNDWGEDGSVRLEQTSYEEGHCGWDRSPEKGSGCKGGPEQVWVCGSCGILSEVIMPHFVSGRSEEGGLGPPPGTQLPAF